MEVTRDILCMLYSTSLDVERLNFSYPRAEPVKRHTRPSRRDRPRTGKRSDRRQALPRISPGSRAGSLSSGVTLIGPVIP